jgi:hypothetical protein
MESLFPQPDPGAEKHGLRSAAAGGGLCCWIMRSRAPEANKDTGVVESIRHPAIQAFLEWARDAVGRDPAFRAKVDAALGELTISPKLKHHIEDELDRITPRA